MEMGTFDNRPKVNAFEINIKNLPESTKNNGHNVVNEFL